MLKKIAIIGSGISGLTAAFELYKDYDVTLFEKEDYFGGHTDTHQLKVEGQSVNIDSGFIIFCPEYYPNFCRMLSLLEVERQLTDMSFSALNRNNGLVYNATSLNKLFCQRRNLLRPRFYRMLLDILRFYHSAKTILERSDQSTTVGEYLDKNHYGKGFSQDHLLPMISALWSATPEHVLQFPIRHLVDFFNNHGLLKILNRPQWYVVKNGSNTYVKALREALPIKWDSSAEVIAVKRGENVEIITRDLQSHTFDAVVMATHADQALAVLEDASEQESAILSAITFQENSVVVHTDASLMHPNKASWASWNTQVPYDDSDNSAAVCTANYWMNSLQGLSLDTPVFTSLNNDHAIDPKQVLTKRLYHHPVFTPQSVAAQKLKGQIDGQRASYFVGAYWGWGFHEDGARSAVEVCKMIREQIV